MLAPLGSRVSIFFFNPLSALRAPILQKKRTEEKRRPGCAGISPGLTCLFSIIFITKAPLRLIAWHYAYRAERLDVSLNPLSAIKKMRFTGMSYRRVRQTFYTQNITRKIIRQTWEIYISRGHNFTDNNLEPGPNGVSLPTTEIRRY